MLIGMIAVVCFLIICWIMCIKEAKQTDLKILLTVAFVFCLIITVALLVGIYYM